MDTVLHNAVYVKTIVLAARYSEWLDILNLVDFVENGQKNVSGPELHTVTDIKSHIYLLGPVGAFKMPERNNDKNTC